MGCTLLIKEGMSSLTATEGKLARYLLENSGRVIHMSVKEFAQACQSSPAAVVRFSKKLGFPGFTELKLDLAKEAGTSAPDEFQTVIHDGDSTQAIIRKAERIHLRNVAQTYALVSVQALDRAVDKICGSRHIHLFGVGASGLLALDFLYKSSRIGFPAFYHSDVHTNLAAASLLGPEDVAVAISYTGETRETVLAARAAKDRGCPIIAVTQANHNTLARLADLPLYIPSEEKEFRVGAMTSRTSGLLILDLLYLGMAKRDPARTEDRLRETRGLINAFQGK